MSPFLMNVCACAIVIIINNQHGYDLGIQIEKIEYCIGHSMKNNRPIFNYIKIMQEHADKVFRAVLDQLL